MEKATVGNNIIEYETRGAGEPVILIHGSVVADSFIPLINEHALTSRYCLVRYHRRGYMGTTHSPPPVSITDQARDCLGLMRKLGISCAHLVGHSYGGVIAMISALEEPAAVHTLTLLEPALIGMVPSGAGFGAALAPAIAKYLLGDNRESVDMFLSLVCGPAYRPELEHAIPGAVDAAAVDARTFFEIEIPAIQEFWSSFSLQQAMRIQQPTLAVVGTASERPLREGHQMIQTWLKAEPREIAGGNHLFPVTMPGQVAEVLAGFLTHRAMS